MSELQIITSDRLDNVHPGDVLLNEFLIPMGMTSYFLAKAIKVPQTRISEIVHGRRAVTADTAVRLSRFFGTTPEFWLNLQDAYDIERVTAKGMDPIEPYVSATN